MLRPPNFGTVQNMGKSQGGGEVLSGRIYFCDLFQDPVPSFKRKIHVVHLLKCKAQTLIYQMPSHLSG